MNKLTVGYKKVLPDAAPPKLWSLPAYARSEVNGHPIKILIPHNTVKLVRTGLRLLVPEGHVAFICSRRDHAKRSLFVVNAPITLDHEEEIKIVLHNGGMETYILSHGDLIANLVVVSGAFSQFEEIP